jgi:hypothetical protein
MTEGNTVPARFLRTIGRGFRVEGKKRGLGGLLRALWWLCLLLRAVELCGRRILKEINAASLLLCLFPWNRAANLKRIANLFSKNVEN